MESRDRSLSVLLVMVVLFTVLTVSIVQYSYSVVDTTLTQQSEAYGRVLDNRMQLIRRLMDEVQYEKKRNADLEALFQEATKSVIAMNHDYESVSNTLDALVPSMLALSKSHTELKEKYARMSCFLTSDDMRLIEELTTDMQEKFQSVTAPEKILMAAMFASKVTDIEFPLLLAVMDVESDFRPHIGDSHVGLMQVSKGVWDTYIPFQTTLDRTDIFLNSFVGASYLKNLSERYDGSIEKALKHYNGGGAALKDGRSDRYVRKVFKEMRKWGGDL